MAQNETYPFSVTAPVGPRGILTDWPGQFFYWNAVPAAANQQILNAAVQVPALVTGVVVQSFTVAGSLALIDTTKPATPLFSVNLPIIGAGVLPFIALGINVLCLGGLQFTTVGGTITGQVYYRQV